MQQGLTEAARSRDTENGVSLYAVIENNYKNNRNKIKPEVKQEAGGK